MAKPKVSVNGTVKPGWKHSEQCSICTLKDEKGIELRTIIEDKMENGMSYKGAQRWLEKGYGISVSTPSLFRHLKNHAPYVFLKKTPEKRAMILKQAQILKQVQEEFADASDALQRIINIGDHYVKKGIIPVDGRLYLDALKEQGRRKQLSTFDGILLGMEKNWIKKNSEEGEIVKGEEVKKAEVQGQKEDGRKQRSNAVSRELGQRLPEPGTVRNAVHVRR